MIKALYVPDYKEHKYGSSFLRLAKYADDIDLIIGSSLGGFLAACCPWTCSRVNTISKDCKEPWRF